MNFFTNFVMAPLSNFALFVLFAKLVHIEPIFSTWTWFDVATPWLILFVVAMAIVSAKGKK